MAKGKQIRLWLAELACQPVERVSVKWPFYKEIGKSGQSFGPSILFPRNELSHKGERMLRFQGENWLCLCQKDTGNIWPLAVNALNCDLVSIKARTDDTCFRVKQAFSSSWIFMWIWACSGDHSLCPWIPVDDWIPHSFFWATCENEDGWMTALCTRLLVATTDAIVGVEQEEKEEWGLYPPLKDICFSKVRCLCIRQPRVTTFAT